VDQGWEQGRVRVRVSLKTPSETIQRKKYPIPLEGRLGLKPIIKGLLKDGLLEPCMSPFNTLILPVRKSDGSYRLVQDLWAINQMAHSKHPVIPNPYTSSVKYLQIISGLVLYIKGCIWAFTLVKDSRDIFAFEWENTPTGRKQQYRWTVLPQGFTDSPKLFGQVLEQVLEESTLPSQMNLLKYMDDLLLSGLTKKEVTDTTISLLNFLGHQGLKI
jgi:hypothetical protein